MPGSTGPFGQNFRAVSSRLRDNSNSRFISSVQNCTLYGASTYRYWFSGPVLLWRFPYAPAKKAIRRSTAHKQDFFVASVLGFNGLLRGWEIAGEYVDCGVSGSKDRRPALDRMMVVAHGRC
jgi:hypothetical protein